MEQHRTRPPQRNRASQAPPAPSSPASPSRADADGPSVDSATVYRASSRAGERGARAVAPLAPLLRRFPNPRLTGIGAGLFAALAMFLLGGVDHLLFDDSALVLGLLFLPVCALTALWVRPADLVTAPIGVPIAFAVGVVPIAGGSGGLGGQTMAVVTALAVHAGWLYGGTLVAGLIATVRKIRQMRQRQYLLAVEALQPATGPGTAGATRAARAARAAADGGTPPARSTTADRPARGGAPAGPAPSGSGGPAPATATARPARRTSRR